MRSRYFDRAAIGADVFAATPTPSCPPGQHWVPDAPPTTLKGMSACVPNVVHLTPIVLRQPPAPVTVQPSPVPTTDRAAAPGAAPAPPAPTCPEPWPLWWLIVAAAAGAGAGYYAERNRKKVKRNAGRIVGRVVNRAGDFALARMLG